MKTIRLRKRTGFTTFRMRLLYYFLYPFFHCRAPLTEELSQTEEPVVFVPNHYNIFGPLSFLHSVALKYSTWMNVDIITPETAIKTVEPGLRRLLPFLGDRSIAWLCRKAAWLTCSIQIKFSPIPVDRNHPASLLTTIRRSMAAMTDGDSLLIFPETGLPEYSLTSVTPFFPAFATIGQVYYRKTGRNLRFIPCYIDAQHRLIRFGDSVTWQGTAASAGDENQRVSEEVNRRIRDMAAASRGEGKEKSSPRSPALLLCNMLRLGLLVPLFLLLSRGKAFPAGLLYLAGEALRHLFHFKASRTLHASSGAPFLLSRALTVAANVRAAFFLSGLELTASWVPWAMVLHGAVLLLLPMLCRLLRCGWAGSCYTDQLAAALTGFFCAIGLLLPAPAPLLRLLAPPVALLLLLSVCQSVILQRRILSLRRATVTSPA